MLAIGVEMTQEDMTRITSAVGTMSVAMLETAEDANDVKEALALHVLHLKLMKACKKMGDELAKANENK